MRALKLEPWKFLAFPSNLPRPGPKSPFRENRRAERTTRRSYAYAPCFAGSFAYIHYKQHVPSTSKLRTPTMLNKSYAHKLQPDM